MKKYFSILALSLCSIFSYSQAPDAFKYQTVVRNATGGIIANQLVKFRLSVLEDSPSGNSIFTETHQETTSNIGLVNFDIGRGQLVQLGRLPLERHLRGHAAVRDDLFLLQLRT